MVGITKFGFAQPGIETFQDFVTDTLFVCEIRPAFYGSGHFYFLDFFAGIDRLYIEII